MKKYCVLFLAFVSFAIVNESCSKDSVAVNISNETIAGKWELRSVEGGFRPLSDSDYLPGNGNILSFTASGNYAEYRSDTVLLSGTYSIVNDTLTGTGMPDNILVIHSDIEYELPVDLTGNTLTLYHGIIAADGYISKYVRIGNE